MSRAQVRNASQSSKFYFRKDVFVQGSAASSISSSPSQSGAPCGGKMKALPNCFGPLPPRNHDLKTLPVDHEYEEMTMDQIMNGKPDVSVVKSVLAEPNALQDPNFPGLLGLVYSYLDTLEVEDKALVKIKKYLDLVKRRSNGTASFAHFTPN